MIHYNLAQTPNGSRNAPACLPLAVKPAGRGFTCCYFSFIIFRFGECQPPPACRQAGKQPALRLKASGRRVISFQIQLFYFL
jgi:hypothetical protein